MTALIPVLLHGFGFGMVSNWARDKKLVNSKGEVATLAQLIPRMAGQLLALFVSKFEPFKSKLSVKGVDGLSY